MEKRIQIRCADKELSDWKAAAAEQGVGLSAFIRGAANGHASQKTAAPISSVQQGYEPPARPQAILSEDHHDLSQTFKPDPK